MNRIELVSRRGFLNQAFTAGALILGTRILPSSALANGPKTVEGTVESAAWRPDLFLGLETDAEKIVLQTLQGRRLSQKSQLSQKHN